MSPLILRSSTSSLSLSMGFRWAKIRLAYFEKGCSVMIPYRCVRASSTVRSSLRFIGTNRIWLWTCLSSFGVKLTLNCVFIPMLDRWRAKMSLNFTIAASKISRSFPVICESVQLNLERKLVRDSSLSVGSSFSSSANSRSSCRIRFCIGECSSEFPVFSGLGNQNFSSLSSWRSTCMKALWYVTTSSRSGNRLGAAMFDRTDHLRFFWFQILQFGQFGVCTYCIEKIRRVGDLYCYFLVSGICHCRGYYEFRTLVKVW